MPQRVELTFTPNIDLIVVVRQFVLQFYEGLLGSGDTSWRLAVATHELLENAVKYSIDGNTSVTIDVNEVASDQVAVDVVTCNKAAPGHRAVAMKMVEEMQQANDPLAHYVLLMERSQARSDGGSGLGFGRVGAEAEMTLDCAVEGDRIRIGAHARCKVGAG